MGLWLLQLRVVRCKMAPVSTGDGSAFFEMGNTKVRPLSSRASWGVPSLRIHSFLTLRVCFQVLAVVYGPREPIQRSQVLPALLCCVPSAWPPGWVARIIDPLLCAKSAPGAVSFVWLFPVRLRQPSPRVVGWPQPRPRIDPGETCACILQVHAEHAVITCEFSMAAFATGERRKRGKVRSPCPIRDLHRSPSSVYVWPACSPLHTPPACAQGDRRSAELATMLRQTLESAVLVELYPRTQIHVFVQVR